MKYEQYEQVWDGEWTTWDWKNNLERCCDCGMVHKVHYRLKGRKLQVKATVDRKRTYAARRRMGVKLIRTKK